MWIFRSKPESQNNVKIGKLCRLKLSLAGCGGSVGDVCDPWLRALESFVFPHANCLIVKVLCPAQLEALAAEGRKVDPAAVLREFLDHFRTGAWKASRGSEKWPTVTQGTRHSTRQARASSDQGEAGNGNAPEGRRSWRAPVVDDDNDDDDNNDNDEDAAPAADPLFTKTLVAAVESLRQHVPTQPTDSSCAGGPDCCARWSALVHHVCANAGLPALILAMLGGQTLCCDFGLGAATIGRGASAQLLACVPAELRTRFAGMTPSPHPAAVTHKQTMQAWGANASHVCTVVPIISAFLGTQPLPKPAILASLAMASKFFDRSWFAAHLIQRATKGDELVDQFAARMLVECSQLLDLEEGSILM